MFTDAFRCDVTPVNWIPESKRGYVVHRRRPSVSKGCPLHVTLRLVEGLPSLRKVKTVRWIRRSIQLAHKDGFRIVHFSVMSNHLHFIVEAADRKTLSRGMGGLGTRLSKRLNQLFARSGDVFKERYHARALRTPTEVRWAMGYVLNHKRKHAAQGNREMPRGWVEPFSSAPHFVGWTRRLWTEDKQGMDDEVTALAEFWLLRAGWMRGGGALDPDAVPGPAP
jgi:REP element-mobilizing transposase RayT